MFPVVVDGATRRAASTSTSRSSRSATSTSPSTGRSCKGVELRPRAGHDQDRARRVGLGQDDDPAPHPRPAEAGLGLDRGGRHRGLAARRGGDARRPARRSGWCSRRARSSIRSPWATTSATGWSRTRELEEEEIEERVARDAGVRRPGALLRADAVRAVRRAAAAGGRGARAGGAAADHALRRAHDRPRSHHRHHLTDLIAKVRDLDGVSSIMVTHQLRDAFNVARTFMLRSGDEYVTSVVDDISTPRRARSS